MTQATVTKTLANQELQDTKYSLGFRRYSVLPTRVRHAIGLAYLIANKSIDHLESTKAFFESMSEEEYVNYLKLA